MDQPTRLKAAAKSYELDSEGNLWTTPRGSLSITQAAVLVIINGLAYKVHTTDLIAHLTPKPKKAVPTASTAVTVKAYTRGGKSE